MPNHSLNLPFDEYTHDDWRVIVEKELKGKPFDDFLFWKKFGMESWQGSLPNISHSIPQLPEAWKVIEPVYESDAKKANEIALKSLMVGAEGIWFDKSFLGAAAAVASNAVDTEIAPIFFNGATFKDAFKPLLKEDKGIDESFDKVVIDGMRLRERGASIVDELALMVSMGIETGIHSGFDIPMLFKSGFGSSYMEEIAKTRAFRLIWSRILEKEGVGIQNPSILGVNLTNSYSINDEHTNILRATSSAMSAILGGSKYLMIEPWNKHWNQPIEFSGRISRNIQVLLKEEAKIDKNSNPADGAYFIEQLTVKMADQAWSFIQHIEQEGGFSAYAQSKKLNKRLQDSKTEILKGYETESVLLGVNRFQSAQILDEPEVNTSTYALLPDYFHVSSMIKSAKS